MAELLIKVIDTKHKDPVKDKMTYKRGDIVEVYEDGSCTEPPSLNSSMVIVKVTGVTKAQVDKYMGAHSEPQTQTRKYSLKLWQDAIIKNSFGEFTTRPTVIREGTTVKGDWVLLEGSISTQILRRKFRLRLEALPLSVKKTLRDKRWIKVSLTQIKKFIRNKITNLDEA